jgi:hypothetical protein
LSMIDRITSTDQTEAYREDQYPPEVSMYTRRLID